MIYVLIGAAIALLVLRQLAPRRYVVRASRPTTVIQKDTSWLHRGDGHPGGRWMTFGFAVDEHGDPIRTTGKFVGAVSGQSMADRGLLDGSTIVADFLQPDEKSRLKSDDIVVVLDDNGKSTPEASQYCLRAVGQVKGDAIEYKDDVKGPHRPHKLDRVVAIVTRTIPIAQPRSLRSKLSFGT